METKKTADDLEGLPSQQAVKSVQGANQAREDVRTELAKTRRASMARRLHAAASQQNQVAPESSPDQVLSYHFKTSNVDLAELGFETCNTEEEQLKQLARLRDMPCPIAVKRMLREQLMSQKVSAMKGWKGFLYKQERDRKKLKLFAKEVSYKTELWQGSFKEIEGHFGTGVVSYFVFLKWLFLLDVLIFSLIFLFIVIPEAVLGKTSNATYVQPCLNSNISNLYQDVIYYGDSVNNCSDLYQTHIDDTSGVISGNYTVVSYIADFIQGTGFMEDTYLFYGFYSSSSLTVDISVVSDYVQTYNLPFMYILVTGFHFSLSLILMVKQSAKGFKETIISTDNKLYQFCNKAFGTWDYALSDPKNVALKKKSIFGEVKHDLNEQRDKARRQARTNLQNFKLWSLRILVNIFVLGALGGSGYLIYYTTETSTKIITTWPEYHGWNTSLQLLIEYMPSLTITILNIIVPLLFEKVVIGEDYTPQTEVQITLIRTVFLRLASLAVLFATLYISISCDTKDYCNIGVGGCQTFYCWETSIGQQLYKLIIIDFVAKVISAIFVEFPRRLIVSKCSCKLAKIIGYQQFIIPKNVLDLVYSQTLCWLGVFYSPLIPALCILQFFITFYTKKISLLSNFVPNQRPYRASRSNSFFVIVLLISFIICCFPLIYAVAAINPSRGCGPFRPLHHMYESLTSTACAWDVGFQHFVSIITSISFSIPIFIVMSLTIYYQHIVRVAQRERINLLKDQLLMEGKDKQFLLGRVNELKDIVGQFKPTAAKPASVSQSKDFHLQDGKISTSEVLCEEDEGRTSNPPGHMDYNV
ncbi:transmembrane channel-like protein 7 [Watersipora subatra]|uniref:transmembrane channel-like protein 7 n=1 Tax=Watersipora subatra TaxID=2589382 RepID=UPI00355C3678